MRSVSSQISRVSCRSSSLADCSRSCAAPRMPESGFLISCASIAPSAVIERAAPRWVICRSILSAMVRSCSITMTSSPASPSGVANTSTMRSAPMRGEPISTRCSLTLDPRCRTSSTSAITGRAERNEVAELLALHDPKAHVEKGFGRRIGVGRPTPLAPMVSTGSGSAFMTRSLTPALMRPPSSAARHRATGASPRTTFESFVVTSFIRAAASKAKP